MFKLNAKQVKANNKAFVFKLFLQKYSGLHKQPSETGTGQPKGDEFNGFVAYFRHLKLQAEDGVSSYGTSAPFEDNGLGAHL